MFVEVNTSCNLKTCKCVAFADTTTTTKQIQNFKFFLCH